MGTLRYFDGALAVCDFEIEQRADERTIKLLLEVDSENPDIEKHVKPLLECWNVPRWIAYGLLSDVERAVIREKIDVAALEGLGFKVDGDNITHPLEFMPNESVRMLVSVPQAVKRIRGLATYLQYLAKLYLLANGDARSASVLPDIKRGEYALEFDAVIPREFVHTIGTTIELPTPARFSNLDFVDFGNDESWLSVSVSIHYADIMRFPHTGNEFEGAASELSGTYLLPEGEFELKCLAASFMLSGLINYQTATPFRTDPGTLAIKRNDSESFASVLADLMIAGKVSACPWCGRPVLLPRKSSKPFCRQSHQTRYSEKARAMLNDGASVDEVSEAFPHIQKATIRGWLPMEGR